VQTSIQGTSKALSGYYFWCLTYLLFVNTKLKLIQFVELSYFLLGGCLEREQVEGMK